MKAKLVALEKIYINAFAALKSDGVLILDPTKRILKTPVSSPRIPSPFEVMLSFDVEDYDDIELRAR